MSAEAGQLVSPHALPDDVFSRLATFARQSRCVGDRVGGRVRAGGRVGG